MRTVLNAAMELASFATSTKRRDVMTVLIPAAMHALRSAIFDHEGATGAEPRSSEL